MDGVRAPTETRTRPPTPLIIEPEGSREAAEETEAAEEEAAEPAPAEEETVGPPTTNAGQEEPKISLFMGVLLIAAALLYDGAEFVIGYLTLFSVVLIPLGVAINFVIDVWAFLTFLVWFHGLGLGTIRKGTARSLAKSLAKNPQFINAFALGIEIIPILSNIVPGWTASVLLTIILNRIETIVAVVAVGQKVKKIVK